MTINNSVYQCKSAESGIFHLMPSPTGLAAEMRPGPGRVEHCRPNAVRFMEIDVGLGTAFRTGTGSNLFYAPVDCGRRYVIKQLKDSTPVPALVSAKAPAVNGRSTSIGSPAIVADRHGVFPEPYLGSERRNSKSPPTRRTTRSQCRTSKSRLKP
jgi:hypothetical protein